MIHVPVEANFYSLTGYLKRFEKTAHITLIEMKFIGHDPKIRRNAIQVTWFIKNKSPMYVELVKLQGGMEHR